MKGPESSGTTEQSAIACNGCAARWTALGAAHCGACHLTFSGAALFDDHRHARGEHGGCHHPHGLTNAKGEKIMFYRRGMWRGPEMTEDQKAQAQRR